MKKFINIFVTEEQVETNPVMQNREPYPVAELYGDDRPGYVITLHLSDLQEFLAPLLLVMSPRDGGEGFILEDITDGVDVLMLIDLVDATNRDSLRYLLDVTKGTIYATAQYLYLRLPKPLTS